MKRIIRFALYSSVIFGMSLILISGCKKDDNNQPEIVKDIDGNVYHTVTVGNQVWMVENLKTTKYNDGTPIPLVTDNSAWIILSTPAFCWYNNDEASNKSTYGALYNWHTINTGKLAPSGWHVPTDDDWTTLLTHLGGETVAGGKLKETGTTHWQSPNEGATNESGLSLLPGGYRTTSPDNGHFSDIGLSGSYWSSSQLKANRTVAHSLFSFSFSRDVTFNSFDLQWGFSVRCIKD